MFARHYDFYLCIKYMFVFIIWENKLECAISKMMFLLEKIETILRFILCNSWFFARGFCEFWFLSSKPCISSHYSSLFWSSSLKEIIKVFTIRHFVSLDKGFFNYFSSNNTPDCLIISFISHRLFAFFYALSKIF